MQQFQNRFHLARFQFGKIAEIDFGDIAALQEQVPIARFEVTQIEAGRFRGSASVVNVRRLWLLRLAHEPGCVWASTIDPDYFHVVLPVRWRGDLIYNGEMACRQTLYGFCDSEGFIGRTQGRDVIAVAVPRTALAGALAALRGVGPEDVRLGPGAYRLAHQALDRLRLGLQRLIAGAMANPSQLEGLGQADRFWQSALGHLVDAYLALDRADPPPAHRCGSPTQIVGRAEERFMACPHRRISLAELCEAAGVSASTLNAAFHIVCGMSPLKFFKMRRLCRARHILLHGAADRGAVKRAAIDAGLTELGRFSVEYRELFGEPPSVTLHAARRPAPAGALESQAFPART